MEAYKPMEYLDFSNPGIFQKQKEALDKVKSQLGKEYPNIINGQEIFTEKKTTSYNPAHKTEIVGIFQKSGKEDAEKAIQAAEKAFETWKYVPAKERAEYLFKASNIIKQRRYEINAWMITEVGKNYLEADADTCEAIDFLEFYGREMIRLSENQPLTGHPDEINEYFYIPLGVGIVIPPWNFPFAIMVGTTAASFVTGNTVVLKPSSDSPMMAMIFQNIMREVGLPDGVFNYLVASGSEAGDYMVDHPRTRFISFTGSMEVGTRIYERAAKVNPGQIWLKRVVAEMGGKDAMLIDSEADVDYAAGEVVKAAFGFQGQKCSACSRAIVDEKIYDEFIEKLEAKAKAITVGDPRENAPAGPVINEGAYNSIKNYIEIGKSEGRLIVGGTTPNAENGYFISPTVIVDVPDTARIAKEEIFGPVLAVIKSKNFDDGVRIFNDTIYGLTGGLITNNPEKLARGKKELHCGNLYLNRKCTGALVDVHPFGGFNMSGTDSKAGSRDYLQLFMQGKSVATKK
ncbi:L-glutamate gamma-semialdehyde dehydrogenase [bacterium]|nr:MAG: L-glutamate gamma-semialdehyde dehydrogenase [bacterium]